MDEKIISAIKNEFDRAEKILLLSHARPDGDAVGSLLGLGNVLKTAGKEVQMVLEDGVPTSFHHLQGSDQVTKHIRGAYDISIVLDCSDLQRVGAIIDDQPIPTINIDHHVTNLNFATINLVSTTDPATTTILTKLCRVLGYPITPPAADALLTGLITDTIGFRTNNMNPEAMRIAADLMEIGADLATLYKESLLDISYQAARFWGAGLSFIQLENRLLWTTLSLSDRKEAGYHGKDDADLINYLSSIKDADVAVIFVEQPDDTVKVSWRSQEGYDVSKIASLFGGGGHAPASGAMINGDLESVKGKVLKATREILEHDKISITP